MVMLKSVVALACVSGLLVAGCGCDPGTNSQRAPVSFSPSSSAAVRTPSTCGVTDPAFSPGDTFSLQLLGATDIAPPYTFIQLDLAATVSVGESTPLMVAVNAIGSTKVNTTTARSSDGSIQFSLATGSDPAELDASPLSSVVVTVTSLPSADGEPLGAELHLGFEDGRVLDQVYSAPLQSPFLACSH
jgi:hypothetical protein